MTSIIIARDLSILSNAEHYLMLASDTGEFKARSPLLASFTGVFSLMYSVIRIKTTVFDLYQLSHKSKGEAKVSGKETIASNLKAYYSNQETIASDKITIASDKAAKASNKLTIASDKLTIALSNVANASGKLTIASSKETITSSIVRFISNKLTLTSSIDAFTSSMGTIPSNQATLRSDKLSLGSSNVDETSKQQNEASKALEKAADSRYISAICYDEAFVMRAEECSVFALAVNYGFRIANFNTLARKSAFGFFMPKKEETINYFNSPKFRIKIANDKLN